VKVGQRRDEGTEIGGSVGGGPPDALHVEPLLGMPPHVAEAHRGGETPREIRFQVPCLGEAPEGIRVTGGRSEVEPQAGLEREIDGDLRRLPKVKDHRIRGVARRLQLTGRARQARLDAGEVALDRRALLGQRPAVEPAYRPISSSTSS